MKHSLESRRKPRSYREAAEGGGQERRVSFPAKERAFPPSSRPAGRQRGGESPPPVILRLPRFLVAHWRTGVICLALTVGIGGLLIPVLGSAYPPDAEAETETVSASATENSATESSAAESSTVEQSTVESPTDAPHPEATMGAEEEWGGAVTLPDEPSADPTEENASPSGESTSEVVSSDATDSEPSSGEQERGTEEDGAPWPETEAAVSTETVTDGETVPDGCFAIVSRDQSFAELGVGYVEGATQNLPSSLPDGRLWPSAAVPTVLIVNSHPLEGYGDGGTYYDPSSGGLSLTDTPNASDGVVALAASLARELRAMGVTVIHLRIAVTGEESAAEVYARTETTVRAYCRAYPEIGLVLDLRRSAELTETGDVLRTAGALNGEACAQVRFSVGGGRSQTALARDLAVALALRAGTWETSPSISRPVTVKRSGGLAAELEGVCFLTLEAGAAGNTWEEARLLISPLARAIGQLVTGEN